MDEENREELDFKLEVGERQCFKLKGTNVVTTSNRGYQDQPRSTIQAGMGSFWRSTRPEKLGDFHFDNDSVGSFQFSSLSCVTPAIGQLHWKLN